ncbi:hypothetical protein [Nocardioides sp.]|uniref:hypothetical protein n=1 Tax=Nocardioides sp. TaxID=35761 RepID=UPI00271D4379|nr:hypothetical protein [Nocardioides sp.]MDO9457178.1 hypothetical protein [Nocardioides sp.]
MRPLPALAVALTAVLALAACDADDFAQNDDVEAVPATVRTGLAVLYAGADAAPGVAAEGACFATGLTDRLSLDELVDAGLVLDDGRVAAATPMLEIDVADAWVDAMLSCTPYADVAARAAGADVTTYTLCLDDAIPPDEVRAALVATLSGGFDSPEVDALRAAEATCA